MKPFRRNFYYRMSDAKALVALVVFALIGIAAFMFDGKPEGKEEVATDSVRTVDRRRDTFPQKAETPRYYDQGEPRVERFAFDPNTADSTQLLRLGLAPYMVRGIYKYRAMGGVYRCPEDFAKVPGLTQKQYRELKPYISISSDYLPASELAEAHTTPPMRDTLLYPRKLNEGEQIALSTTDTTLLKRVPGIGSHFARAIVRYGERLGGYVSVEQLDEIDCFPSEAKKYFKVVDSATVRMNVNKLSVHKMKRHPYMGFFRAKIIDDYRRVNGPLKSLDDVASYSYHDFTAKAIERLRPYVEF